MGELFGSNGMEIPGVRDAVKFTHWVTANSIKINPDLRIVASKLGGIGLEFNDQQPRNNDLELLRVPYGSVLDYKTLLTTLNELKERDLRAQAPLKESNLVVDLLTIVGPTSETEILTCYVVAFHILKKLRNSSEYFKKSPSTKFDVYLDILTHTETLDYPLQEESTDPFLNKLIESSRAIKEHFKLFWFEFNKIYPVLAEKLSFEEYYQIVQAIRSRTLEIPHEQGKSIEQKFEDLSIEDGDFVVNVSLVPMLDFCNHRHDNNAYFDVDRKNGDILLKLKKEAKDVSEITISYSPVEKIQDFIITYGFLPSWDYNGYQVFEFWIPTFEVPDASLICKWLGVKPAVQIIRGKESNEINVNTSDLPLLYVRNLEFNQHWEEDCRDLGFADDDIYAVKYLENHSEVVRNIPIGVKYKGKPLADVEVLVRAVDESVTEKCLEDVIQQARAVASTSYTHRGNLFDDMAANYIALQKMILDQLIAKYEADGHLPLPEGPREWVTMEGFC